MQILLINRRFRFPNPSNSAYITFKITDKSPNLLAKLIYQLRITNTAIRLVYRGMKTNPIVTKVRINVMMVYCCIILKHITNLHHSLHFKKI